MGMIAPIVGLFYAAALPAGPVSPIVLGYESGVEAYAEAVEGIGGAIDGRGVRAIDLQMPSGVVEFGKAIAARETKLVIVVGSRALSEAQARKPGVPLLATMVLHGAGESVAGHVDLEIPLSMQLQTLRTLLPRATRVAIIHNPARSRFSTEELQERARREGFTAVVVDCDGPAHLLKAVGAMKGKADFLLCFPDPDLYNAVTIKPLMMALIEERLPLVGFSPAFVRAGAAAGIYPDYREVGRQTAAIARRLLRGEAGSTDEPAKVKVAVNQRVARLIGVEFQTGPAVEVLR